MGALAKGKKRVIPNLEAVMAEILGEELYSGENSTALYGILKSMRVKAFAGDVKAATLLLEYTYGKPKQFIEQITKNQVDLSSLSVEELFLVQKIQEKNNVGSGSDNTNSVH
jgi:hypothetical protein